MAERRAGPLPRVLAPIALAVAAVLFLAVIVGIVGGGGGGESTNKGAQREAQEAGAPTAAERREPTAEPRTGRSTYTVKTGDTLGGISEETGVSVERLQELNPELDPQALVSGQKIKLRE